MLTNQQVSLWLFLCQRARRAEILLRDEVPLWHDCLLMEKRITGWDSDQEKVEKKCFHGAAQKRSLKSDITYDLPKEVADYQVCAMTCNKYCENISR